MTMSTSNIPYNLRQQLESVDIEPHRPLLISDADEVLFAFMVCFERYMERRGAYFDCVSYRLNGNIHSQSDKRPLSAPEVKDLINGFFREETRDISPIVGAATTLQTLSKRMQVVVLSNVPLEQHDDRRHALVRHGMDYPLIANTGSKAPAVQILAARTKAPVVFIDDSPSHHREVAELSHDVRRIHYVGDARLSALLDPAEHSHYRADSWDDIKRHIEEHLAAEGH